MLQPYKSFVTVCAVASLLYAQTAPRPLGTVLKVKPMLDGRAIAHNMKIIKYYNAEAYGNRK